MRNLLRPIGGVAAILAALSAIPAAQAQSPEQIKAATTSSVNKLNLQTELPLYKPTEKREDTHIFSWVAPLGDVWIYIILGGAGVLLLFAFREQIMTLISGRPTFIKKAGESGAEELTLEAGARTGAAADELASQGHYMEAMHMLLLRALTEMRQRIGEQFADSSTSREILRHARLSDPGRDSLRDIIARVEWSYFGEHPVAGTDYSACRASFDRFVIALDKERNA